MTHMLAVVPASVREVMFYDLPCFAIKPPHVGQIHAHLSRSPFRDMRCFSARPDRPGQLGSVAAAPFDVSLGIGVVLLWLSLVCVA